MTIHQTPAPLVPASRPEIRLAHLGPWIGPALAGLMLLPPGCAGHHVPEPPRGSEHETPAPPNPSMQAQPAPPAAPPVLPFVRNDYAAARDLAVQRKLPIFAEVWAKW